MGWCMQFLEDSVVVEDILSICCGYFQHTRVIFRKPKEPSFFGFQRHDLITSLFLSLALYLFCSLALVMCLGAQG